jgi:hypothetical protein
VVTDFNKSVTITYRGILPDLFREGQGIVALGKLNADGVVVADEVLAKHDEKYMPPEVTKALKDSGQSAPTPAKEGNDVRTVYPRTGPPGDDPGPVPGAGAGRGAAARRLARRPPVDEPGAAGAWGQFAFLLFAFGCLTYAFMTDDFSVAYVASNSNSALPWYYKFSAVWGAHGSLLLWALILGGWTFAVSVFSRQLPQVMLARVLAVMGMISTGFLLFLILTSNPFSASCRRCRRTVVTSTRCCRTSA